MRRRRNSARYELPIGIVDEVKGICRDYKRKRAALSCGEVSGEVKALYERYNEAVNNALLSIEPELRAIILDDVIDKRGYYKSLATAYIAHRGYESRKCKLIYQIAVNLSLI